MRTATLTFPFTDIEGHSELWDRHPDAMSVALSEHDELIASVVADAGGRVVKNAALAADRSTSIAPPSIAALRPRPMPC